MKLKFPNRKTLNKGAVFLGKSIAVSFITLCLFEVVYRYQWVDFYLTELEALTPKPDLELKKDRTLLVFGDSFSAHPESWVKTVRDSLIDWNVINSSIPGTSVYHQKLFFEDRIEEFKPNRIVIQLYVGNDLIDYNRPQNFSNLSLARNLYWWISDWFISLQYVNKRLGALKSANGSSQASNKSFSISRYNSRVKNYIASHPPIFQESINCFGSMKEEFEDLKDDLEYLINVSKGIPISIVIVPMACQTSQIHFENMVTLGAKLDYSKIQDFTFFYQLEKELENDQVEVVSPLSYFKNNPNPLYFLNDPHLTNFGQKKLGQYIIQEIF